MLQSNHLKETVGTKGVPYFYVFKYAVGNEFPHGYMSFIITLVEIQQDKRIRTIYRENGTLLLLSYYGDVIRIVKM